MDSVSFSIERGETFGLLGPNGAGKSTTIGMLVGLIKPDSGQVFVAGENPVQLAVRNRIGIAPQSLSLYDNLSAQENLRFFGSVYGLHGIRLNERVAWALDFSGLTDRAKDRVNTFSGGMKRRLNIAVGLIHEPEILLLDEPTVGVDPQSRNHILECISQLAKSGLAIIYTTHYMEEAEKLCDRVAIIDHGRILANETVDEMLRKFGGKAIVTADVVENPNQISLPGVPTSGSLEFKSDRAIDELAALQSQGVRFGQVKIDKPNLEGVFLSLTGRSLRD